MTNDELCIARVLFANQIYQANGFAFQKLLCGVMKCIHGPGFVEVRPHGAIGDQGNDGYIQAVGHYFQVYGPIDPIDKGTTAAKKLVEDFAKLKKHWSQITPLRVYSFAFNDKYNGVFTLIAKAIGLLSTNNPGITCLPYSAADLTNAFLELKSNQMQSVLGQMLPDPSRIRAVDFGVLRDVVLHIMNSPARAVPSRLGDLPQLGEKIRVNSLCEGWAALLKNAARRAGHVDSFFAKNATFGKQALKDHLVAAYQPVRDSGRAIATLTKGVSREDIVFANFRQSLIPPEATQATEDALDILIGYYFEACDVFDPNAPREAANASP
jgi:hypothetical protein